MKTDVIKVSGREDDIIAALGESEKAAAYEGLSHKNALHLRLLTEEMIGLIRAVAGDIDGSFWIETEGDEFRLHLKAYKEMDYVQRDKLISVSTSGKNEAHRGLMGKIRSLFEAAEEYPFFFDISADEAFSDETWSLRAYQNSVTMMLAQEAEGAKEAWDELERSVVTRIADDVKVGVSGNDIEVVIIKKMH